nr:probable leucine-rich repeat receptor-like protein kinase At1g35710 [Tanacetum cinerariifolium]
MQTQKDSGLQGCRPSSFPLEPNLKLDKGEEEEEKIDASRYRRLVEAEYRSMATAVSEIMWVRWLLKELDVAVVGPTPLFCDNQSAKHIANNPVFHERTKHVEMDCYFVRERVERKEIMPVHINLKQQIADLLTKPLCTHLLQTLLVKLSIRNLHAPT